MTPSSSASGFAMIYLLGNLKWISPDSKISFLTDQDVDGGSIFQGDGSNAFDVVILGHQEYVTQKEYDNLKQFVAEGGTMIYWMVTSFMLKSSMIGLQEM